MPRRLLCVLALVLMASTAWGYTFATGSYTVGATASDNRDIDISSTSTFADFTPLVVLVKCNGVAYARFNVTGTDSTLHMASSTVTGANVIQAFASTGFQLGTSVDAQLTNSTCYYVAFGADGTNNDIATGSYQGTGIAHSIDISATSSPSVADFQPVVVLVKSSGTGGGTAMWRTTAMAGNLSCFVHNAACVTDGIQALNSTGFDVGDRADINADTVTYRYLALKASSTISVGSVLGNGADNRDITTPGFEPQFGWVHTSTGNTGRMRFAAQGGDASSPFTNVADVTDCLQSFLSTGFQVGTSVNCNDATATVYWFMVREQAPASGGRRRVRILW